MEKDSADPRILLKLGAQGSLSIRPEKIFAIKVPLGSQGIRAKSQELEQHDIGVLRLGSEEMLSSEILTGI
jgi:hypothetical protein